MRILGISCFYHDSAACLLVDGRPAFACQEERFSRIKHDSSFPTHAVANCLSGAGITCKELDCVVFYEKPFRKFERIIETWLEHAPFGLPQFLESAPAWTGSKLWIESRIRRELSFSGPLLFCGHHQSHSASAFYPSPFDRAAVVTVDGTGEWDTASIGIGQGASLRLLRTLRFPHSLGLLYSAFTGYCGFRVNSGEYKLMGLAPFGKPLYESLIREKLIDLRDDGSFTLDMKYFDYCRGLRMTNRRFHQLFGGPPRVPEGAFEQRHLDIAASIQKVAEEVMLRICRHAHALTGEENLCLAGGVALNCVANARILAEGPFKNVWIQPASGDAGGALGAALHAWHAYFDKPRATEEGKDLRQCSLLGPEFTGAQIEEELKRSGCVYSRLEEKDIPETAAGLLSQGKVVGWFQGRMEFGPRALGCRSILGDPRDPGMQSRMNLKIKFRESFRPFAASVLEEKAGEWFNPAISSPYMLLTSKVRQDKRVTESSARQGLDSVNDRRSLIPAVTHVDHSCRLQTVSRRTQPLFYDTIAAFEKITGCPCVINTSFNVRGEPIVCTPADALNCFMNTDIDCLVIGNYLLRKEDQKSSPLSRKAGTGYISMQSPD